MQYAKLTTSLIFALCLFAPQFAGATTYYIDFSLNTGTRTGLSVANAFNSLDQFTEAARNPGDIAFVKRGVASTTNVSDLTFTSDGTIANPIIITADYDNIFGNFATSSQTYTVAAATSTFTASAAQSDIEVGEWVYVAGDCYENALTNQLNQCEYAYEVAAVSSTSIRFYMPYKGSQTGAGLSLRILPPNPQWNTAAGDFQWIFDADDGWFVKGMDIRGTDVAANVSFAEAKWTTLADTIFTGNGASDYGVAVRAASARQTIITIQKGRFSNQSAGNIYLTYSALNWGRINIYDTYIVQGAAVPAINNQSRGGMTVYLENTYVFGGSYAIASTIDDHFAMGRNVVFSGQSTGRVNLLNNSSETWYFEDYNGTIGNNVFISGLQTSVTPTDFLLQSNSATLRSGGGPVSIQVNPTTNIGQTTNFNRVKLFEYPIYTDDTSKQYDVYFMSPSDTWTSNPVSNATSSQLWIECEYWAHDTNATSTRKITKSTGSVDFNGSTDWQSLSVTCDPSQSGILYLRGWYAKPKEAGTNLFYVDGTPVIN